MVKKRFLFGLLVLLVVFSSNGCATIFHTKEATVRASSGSNTAIQVFEDGVPIYAGPLPAQFSVKSKRSYSVHYTRENGESGIISIHESFNGWFIGSLVLGLLPAIVDVATGNVMHVKKVTRLPINYSPVIILGEDMPYHQDLEIIGNFMQESETFADTGSVAIAIEKLVKLH